MIWEPLFETACDQRSMSSSRGPCKQDCAYSFYDQLNLPKQQPARHSCVGGLAEAQYGTSMAQSAVRPHTALPRSDQELPSKIAGVTRPESGRPSA